MLFAVILIFGFFISAVLFAIAYYKSVDNYSGLRNLFLINSLFALVAGSVYVASEIGFLERSSADFLLIFSIIGCISAVVNIFIYYCVSGRKHVLFFLTLFLIAGIPLRFDIVYFFATITLTSFVLSFLVFSELFVSFSKVPATRKAAIAGIAYSLFAIAGFCLVFFWDNPVGYFLLAISCILHGSCTYFMSGILKSKFVENVKNKTEPSLPALFIRYSLFVLGICSFVFLSTISVHELGHTLVALVYGCEAKTVIFSSTETPHTEFSCQKKFSGDLITAGGVLLPLIVGLLFMLTSEKLTTIVSYLIMGFDLFVSYSDLKEMHLSQTAIYLVIFLSVITIIIGIIKLSVYYLFQQASSFFYETKPSEDHATKK